MKEKKILLVEDDPDHADLILDIFNTEAVKGDVVLMRDGHEVIDYLRKIDTGSISRKKPQIDLIILDLNLPRFNGMDVLKSLKGDSRYRSIPVVILSASSEQNTISEAYKNGANGYIAKPTSYDDEFVDKIRLLMRYWSDTNTLPPQA